MKFILQGPALIVALLLGTLGALWLLDPALAAPQFDIELPKGRGLSTIVGIISAFALTISGCVIVGILTQKRTWFYPAILLLLLTAIGRVIATAHDGPMVIDRIMIEVVMAVFVLLAAFQTDKGAEH